MKSKEIGGQFLVRFEPGEALPEALVELARQRQWPSATVSGIGAVKHVSLGYFDLDTKEYVKFDVPGEVEVISLLGNLADVDGAPFWHIHVSVGDRDGVMHGGHLFHLEVAVTLECWIRVGSARVTRSLDHFSALKLLDL